MAENAGGWLNLSASEGSAHLMKIDYQETAQDLQTRIDIHQKYGGRDIDTWMLDLLAPKKGWRILDVGCGAGKQCEAFHRHLEGGGVIVGADISTELLAQAKQLGAELGNAFHLLDSDFNRDLPLAREHFDLVTCCFAIYYADDANLTIDEMHRVLKPGGTLFATGPMPENKRLFYDVIKEATNQPIPNMPGSSRYGSEILQVLQNTFTDVQVHIFENPLTFDEAEPFLAYVRASLSEDRRLWSNLFRSEGDFDKIMDRVAVASEKRLAQDGELVMTKVVGGFIARR